MEWGLFEADGKTPIALGHEWPHWICLDRKWVASGYECKISGEWVDTGFTLEPACKTTWTAKATNEN